MPNHNLSYDNVLGEHTLLSLPIRPSPGSPYCFSGRRRERVHRFPLRLAARCHGRPDTGFGADSRGHDGDGRRLPDRSIDAVVHDGSLGAHARVGDGLRDRALGGINRRDPERLEAVMAYSTVSQLGYMFMALGAGSGNVARLAVVAAMFHLFTHAFFKALLFLASGSVMHAMGDVIDMRRFGGLRHRLPYTCCDVRGGGTGDFGRFLLSGFFSKDEILVSLKSASGAGPRSGPSMALGLLSDLSAGRS